MLEETRSEQIGNGKRRWSMTDALYWMQGRVDTADIWAGFLASGVSYTDRGWVSEDDALEDMERWRRNLKCSLRRLWHVFLCQD